MIELDTDAENLRNVNMLKRLGYTMEGVMKKETIA
jgi:RimJ/RimL family protein N-acetyltransferase